jgi:ABC-type nitrate/sulfonate/bicarbonate transport system permease component
MKKTFNIFEPFKVLNKQTLLIVITLEILFALLIWQSAGGQLIPSPLKVVKSFLEIISSKEFLDNLFSSVGLTLKGMFFSILIALLLSYLALIPVFRPITVFITKCRYLTLTGLIFLFTLITQNGHQLKISLLIFGIVPFL